VLQETNVKLEDVCSFHSPNSLSLDRIAKISWRAHAQKGMFPVFNRQVKRGRACGCSAFVYRAVKSTPFFSTGVYPRGRLMFCLSDGRAADLIAPA